jgi:hypothetical protein
MRIHGWLEPPTTGNYTFWIASDDYGELWLSTSENPAGAVLIANVPGWTNSREWAKYPDPQESDPIPLVAGQKYYIRGLMKEGGGDDMLCVAWQGPADSPVPTRVIIDGEYLRAFPYDPLNAWGPYPRDGATDVQDRNPTLSWHPGYYVQGDEGHKLYFSQRFADVCDRDPAAFIDALTEPNYTIPAPPLLLGTTYYWAVDEVNDGGPPPGEWKGRVWSFTLAECFTVDHMEDYNDRWEIRGKGSPREGGVWTDGFNSVVWGGVYPLHYPENKASSGSNLNTSTEVGSPYGATGPIYGGEQAMVFRYDNDGHTYPVRGMEDWDYDAENFSEIEANTVENLKVGQDWTGEGLKFLTLWFQGHPISDGSSDFSRWNTTTYHEYTVTGRGRDIWGGHDEFYYLAMYPWIQPTGVTTRIQTRVVRMDNTNPWAKAGVMIREKMTPYSRFAAVYVTPSYGVSFQWRDVEGGICDQRNETAADNAYWDTLWNRPIEPPIYLKLERDASNAFTASYSNTAESWDWHDVNVSDDPPITSWTVVMDDPCLYGGAAVTSHDGTQLCVADFNNWDASPWPEGQPWVWGNIGLNDTEQMYIALQDTDDNISVVEHNDVNAAILTSWQEWPIKLSDFVGVNLNAIKKVRIGLGYRDAPQPGGSGALYIDEIQLCPPKCVPTEAKPEGDIAIPYDCIVDEKDIRVLAADWLAKEETQDWDHRVAYWDPCYPTAWVEVSVSEVVRDYLVLNGYTVLDANELKTWMDARIADEALSVVVFCKDIVPETVAETAEPNCTIRRYLDAGGKVVWYSDIPFYYQGHADGTTTTWGTDGSLNTLGFNAASAGWNSGDLVTITYHGLSWGLTQTWNSLRPTAVGNVDTVLATDSDGDAAAWAKHYLPEDNFRGFVRISDFDVSPTSPLALIDDLLRVAEYRGALPSDFNEDNVINFKDYNFLANQYLDEILWPTD